MFLARITLASVVLATCISPAIADSFGFDQVAEKAKALAAESYKAPEQVPQFLRDLSYDQYREVRFKPEASLWRDEPSKFEVMMMAPGSFYGHPVRLNEIDSDGVRQISFDKSHFDFPNDGFSKRIPADLGYTGFKLTYPLTSEDTQNQFLVFAGASYFRGVGSDNNFGLSARGIAIDTGLSSGEEYPAFIEYWLEQPSAEADSMVVYGLLDGPSVTGAYRFEVYPGEATRVDVSVRLYMRRNATLLGFAPLTSMFYYGENTPRPFGEWRPQAHDSDGLLVHDGASGEWLWRPLTNPETLRVSYLQTENIKGFGLMQRDREFHHFEDMEARYENRPSAWVKPQGEWGKGDIVLVEIPTHSETNDNMVAFWRSEANAQAGDEFSRRYQLFFGEEDITDQPGGRAKRTFVGDGERIGGGDTDGAFRFIVDFAGNALDGLKPDASVISKVSGNEKTEVIEHFVEYIEPKQVWRLSMLVKPDADATLSLRAFLEAEGEPLTETWTYELPAGQGLRGNANN
ncbi:glucan biosynthesis protein G [Marinobacter salicampi]|uniref:glucan biosynthesis protein G n=1 Tax=Marinobacter salicampi TaxID=435907 RepID=UPI00140D0ED9|nr:glucan biosynthesis protein G [Marinobacter salicampi]